MRFIILFLWTNWSILLPQSSKVIFDVQPNIIWNGDSALVNWHVKGAKEVFISSFGKVASIGQKSVHPEISTVYTLIAEFDQKIISKSVYIQVQGSKGTMEPPAQESFKYSFEYQSMAPSLIGFLEHIRRALQDTLKFSNVHPLKDPQNEKYIFNTPLSPKRYLVSNDETRISERRIAYLVEVDLRQNNRVAPSKMFSYRIKTFIQYKRRLEQRAREETNEELYQQEALRLKKIIDQIAL